MTHDPDWWNKLFGAIHLQRLAEESARRTDRILRASRRAGAVARAAGIKEIMVPSPGEPGASLRIVVPDPGDYGWSVAGGSSMINVILEPGSLQHRIYRLWLRSYQAMMESAECNWKLDAAIKKAGEASGLLRMFYLELERVDDQIKRMTKKTGEGLVETHPEATGGGDFEEVCSVCGEVVDLDPHTWRECATGAVAARNAWHDSWIDRVMQHEQDEDTIDSLRRQLRRLQTGREIESDYITDMEAGLQRDLDESRDHLAEAVQSLSAAQDEIAELRAKLKGES